MRRSHEAAGCCEVTWLSVVFLAAAFVRLLLLPAPGNGSDLNINEGWALSGVVYGTPASYAHQDFGGMPPNYPPLSLSMFSAVGRAYSALSPTLNRAPLLHAMVKLPGVLADLAICGLLYAAVRRRHGGNKALGAAVLYAVHPAAISNGAIWGQIDAVHSAFMLAFMMAAADRRWFAAGVLVALGLLSKVQTALLGPLCVVLLFADRRSLWALPLGGITAFAVVLAPFAAAGHLADALKVFTSSVNFYQQVSLNAYNLWYAIFGSASFGTGDSLLLEDVISLRAIGLLLFLGTSVLLLWSARPGLVDTRGATANVLSNVRFDAMCIAAAGLAFAFFAVNTQMHERYLQPFVALGLPLIFLGWRWAVIYGLSTTLFTINMMAVIGGNGWTTAFMRNVPHAAYIVAIVQTTLFAWFLVEALLWRRRALNARRA